MIFKFTLLSDEVDDFMRVISINSDASFLDLHKAILDSVDFNLNLLTSFFLCSDDWEKEQEITLIEMDTSSEYDNYTMEDTRLEDLLEDEKQKLLFVFDMISDRVFFMELSEIMSGNISNTVELLKSVGNPPIEALSDDDILKDIKIDIDQEFYGDAEFDMDELDNFDGDLDNIDVEDSSFYE